MDFKRIRSIGSVAFMFVTLLSLSLAGCGGGGGGGGGVSAQVVSGVASVGAILAGQVSLKDSSSTPQEKTTEIGSDGSFAIDVTGMKAPYVLRATGNAVGTNYKLHSYADGTGIANINPLSDAIVASAARVDDASEVYDNPDSNKLDKIKANLAATIATLLDKLQPLLQQYNAQNTNPITVPYIANHINLDDMFDNVKIKVANGILSILNAKTGAVIYSGNLTDIANGNFYPGAMPPSPDAPTAPTGLAATGGAGQVTISWTTVSNATSYNIYYSTSSGVTTATGTRIAGATNPQVQSGLTAGTTYYYIVTAVNSGGESAPSAQASATTTAAPPVPAVPGIPTGLKATAGTKQVTVIWSVVSGATSYNLYWAKTPGVTTATGTKIAGATSPAVHSSLSDSTSYYYIVTAVNSVGESAASLQVSATTLTPTPVPTPTPAPTATPVPTPTPTPVPTPTPTPSPTPTPPPVPTPTPTPVPTPTPTPVPTPTPTPSPTPTPAPVQTWATYNTYCSGCHGSSKQGVTLSQLQSAIATWAPMSGLSSLPLSTLQAIVSGQ